MDRIDTAAETALPGLTRHEAYPTLRAHLALCDVDGHNPADMLRHALSSDRDLADARDVAAVLDWRLDPTGHRSTTSSGTESPLSCLPAVPDALSADDEWGNYLHDRSDQVTATSGEVAARAHRWTPTSAPGWALTIIDRDPALAVDLAVWRAANDVPDTDRRPTGPPLPAAADARAQRALDQRVTRLLGDPRAATAHWKPLADSIDERITADPYWPTLADRLTIAERAGIDVTSLTHAVGGESPLPDEQAAAALWWRLSRHLSPAATTATDHSVSDTPAPGLDTRTGRHRRHRRRRPSARRPRLARTRRRRHHCNITRAPRRLGRRPTAHHRPRPAPRRPTRGRTATPRRTRDRPGLEDRHAHRPSSPASRHARRLQPPHPIDEPPTDLDDLRALPDGDPQLDDDWLASLTEPDLDEPEPEPLTFEYRRREDLTPARDGAALRYVTDIEQDPIPAQHAALDARDEERDFARAAEDHFWATAAVPRDRLVELNSLAEDFFTDHYRDAWAPTYLADRLGTDLTGDARFSVGYAPARWTTLTDHLHRHGAYRRGDRGRWSRPDRVHRPRHRPVPRPPRLPLPIKATNTDGDPEIHGWIGRRNPAHDSDQSQSHRAGPKYLNTAETDLFHKGNELYGLTEATPALAEGAAVVLVEGPLDAIAVTLAGDGDFVGVAPLGTAFTDTQADKLRPHIGSGKPDPIVATDADTAGQTAAYRAFWQLTARTANPKLRDLGRVSGR